MANILIAAHDETLRHLLGTALRRFDHDVIMSVNGKHILDLIQKDIFDLAIIDENLQDTTALEILEQVGGHLGLSVKYMVMSSKSSADVIRGYIESGATDFVLKPFSLPKVVTRIESILNSKPAPKVMRAEEYKAS
ncbi:MAG: response regulator [Nitrospinaceae bacterium]|nr:response regulator [Nitrospinaceae bacterium]MBT3434860.1 response regulator [Nitrospinaceae bacterium]MBT4094237.1 response regulator [Nitrospinaceae bacterium]MBT4430372.1 response regulator [Nitrospinaceae bacterium]MBT5368954.1 response regulator [Nitrospinaceae bacterium]